MRRTAPSSVLVILMVVGRNGAQVLYRLDQGFVPEAELARPGQALTTFVLIESQRTGAKGAQTMKRDILIALGLCSSLLVMSAVADDRRETALGSAPAGADKAVTGKQTGEETSAVTGDAGGSASDAAVTTEEKGEAAAVVGRGTASGAAAGKPKRAGTGTAAGYINDQVKKGNVKIQGATDADIYK